MSEESDERLDAQLVALFQTDGKLLQAAPQAAAADQLFCSRLAQRVRQLRRWRRLRALGALATVALGGALLLHAGAGELGDAAAFSAGAGLLHTGAWLVSPAGWVCSLLLGAAALWRLRSQRR